MAHYWQWYDISVQNWPSNPLQSIVSVTEHCDAAIRHCHCFLWTGYSKYYVSVDMVYYYGLECVSEPLWQPYILLSIWIISDLSLSFTNIK